jgi:t-SNARE complex subunit (syntaxin)
MALSNVKLVRFSRCKNVWNWEIIIITIIIVIIVISFIYLLLTSHNMKLSRHFLPVESSVW